ncbi:hypothetical protein DFJ74DRAFT_727936 [Hyaloraphidium curvatum]|nr:hypothetical protein DFJ74DRAFT_727936 [Hyaloraphidium curvatum]
MSIALRRLANRVLETDNAVLAAAPEGARAQDWSPTDLAAAGGHAGFLAAWAELVGPFHLGDAFRAALEHFAHPTLAWMLDNAARLESSDPGDGWLASLDDREGAKRYLAVLANQDIETHDPDEGYASWTGMSAADLGRSEDACRRCFDVLFCKLFARFPRYPVLWDQLASADDEKTFEGDPLATPLLVNWGYWTTYRAMRSHGHGPTARTWMRFFEPLTKWPGQALGSRYFLRMLEDFFGGDGVVRREVALWMRPHALKTWRNPAVYKLFLDLGCVECGFPLVHSILDLDEPAVKYISTYQGRRDLFLSLKLLLERMSSGSNDSEAYTDELAQLVRMLAGPVEVEVGGHPTGPFFIVDSRRDERMQPVRWRSYLLLLLSFGPRRPAGWRRRGPLVGAACGYRRLMDDVLEVARWKRWVATGAIGGLPPELGRAIMFEAWMALLKDR